ncbi:hypothetical protein P22_1001 [Propionispora sp. 2/2-37]|uniref:ribose 5-phosphate isomerase B n=1 Tax=Propionispora sp. 2/2-37 TaxID=1677858 RepID=UPI0006BB7800|nr:ribose 5-phosphate isomerase B [Propionispora sp. 2/2-37]CUH94932.1 hypothetical protein P22_1001 [Propionispora sp. 2/2-37]
MKISLGSDHAGYEMKEKLKQFLLDRSITVMDCGPGRGDQPVEYVPIAQNVAQKAASGETDGGILICGTGIGMSIAANKVPGIRAGLCNELFTARYAKSDVNINVLCMGSRIVSQRMAEEITTLWLETPFTGGRFIPRLQQLKDLEDEMRQTP